MELTKVYRLRLSLVTVEALRQRAREMGCRENRDIHWRQLVREMVNAALAQEAMVQKEATP
jgi:hypothetical protein